MTTRHRRAVRWLVNWLRPELRQAYGEDFAETLDRRLTQIRSTRGRAAAVRYWLSALGDVVLTRIRPRQYPSQRPDRPGVVLRFFGGLRHDLHYAGRSLRHAPGITLLILIVLGIGIGAVTTTFTVMDAVLLRPSPLPDPDRVVEVWIRQPGRNFQRVPPASVVVEWKARTASFSGIAWYTGAASSTLSGLGAAQVVRRQFLDLEFLHTVRVHPTEGRAFAPEDMDGDLSSTVLLAQDFWREQLAGDQSVIGRTVVIGDRPRQVIGVLPLGFQVGHADGAVDVWIARDFRKSPGGTLTLGRLKAGVSREQALAELQAIFDGVSETSALKGSKVEFVSLGDSSRAARQVNVWQVFGAAALVLLVCCANVGGLMLVRGAGRERETASR